MPIVQADREVIVTAAPEPEPYRHYAYGETCPTCHGALVVLHCHNVQCSWVRCPNCYSYGSDTMHWHPRPRYGTVS